MIAVQTPENVRLSFPVDLLVRAANQTLQYTATAASSGLTIVLTDDAQLRQLNQQYLGIDAPTDVLSFPDGEIDPDSRQPYLGDILISLDRAQAQATAYGHTLEEELQLLVVHGVLHLLGYDHAVQAEKAAMWQMQQAVFAQLGVPSAVIRDE